MAFNPTKEQKSAIEAKGNILVSAAAGSGKTAVLVERVISMLCTKDNGISADKLLIVTFTNAAAAEMRSRIEKRLEEEISKNPHDASLLVQKHLLSGAKICTIDSFCIDLVRENFDKLNITPDFKISDGSQLKTADEKVLSRIINRYLEEKNAVFAELLDIIGAEYDESGFIKFIGDIYNYSRQLPFPEKWFRDLCGYYNNGIFDSDNIWYKYAFDKANSVIDECQNSLAKAIDMLFVSETAVNKFMGDFTEAADRLETLKNAALSYDWDVFYRSLIDFSLPKLATVRGVSDIYEVTAAKDIYKYIGSKAAENLKKIFFADSVFINTQFKKLYQPLKLLSDILTEFDRALFEEYKRLNTFTFHNTEHLALELLCEEKDGKIEIRQDSAELLNRYEEVMVDEYQDTNDLQDMLFYVLSNRESNLFAVGDVKQSIYGFRGANPKNFLAKKSRYIPIETAEPEMPKKIILGNNFRCREEICDFVNFMFTLFMTENTGDIVYGSEERLTASAKYPETENAAVEISLINTKGSDIPEIRLEAREIADYIRRTMSQGKVIRVDSDTLRNAEYSDFTVLLRSAKLKAPVLAQELKRQGIPVTYNAENFTESLEIAAFLSLLKVIDNPSSEVELLSCMMSPIFAFTAEELAKIRIANRQSNFYAAIVNSAENGNNKAEKFLESIEKFRLYAAVNPLEKLINILLDETGFLQLITAMQDGMRRRNNLLLLCDYAEQYSSNGNASLGGFVRFMDRQSQTGLKAAGVPAGGNSVRIMSIHASKGLQFPVCIISGLSFDFNDNEARENTLYSVDFGIGFKYFDEIDKTKYTTVSREAILDRIRSERLCEELRLLYVAMTRAQDRLFMTSSLSDTEKKAGELKTMLISSGGIISKNLFARTKSYSDWLILTLLSHPDGKQLRGNDGSVSVTEEKGEIKLNIIGHEQLKDYAENPAEQSVLPQQELISAVKNNINYRYAFEDILSIEAKASVSRLANSAESMKYAFSIKPAFMSKGGITAAERGTAMHKVLEFFDFSNSGNIGGELERLYEWQYISEREYKAINTEKLKVFFESDIFRRIKASGLVKREMRFLTEIPARRIEPELNERFENEKIIVQGAVDVCFTEPDGVVILDFKTDRVDSAEELIKAYSGQLDIYAAACEKIFGMPVKQKIIYSFSLSCGIDLI